MIVGPSWSGAIDSGAMRVVPLSQASGAIARRSMRVEPCEKEPWSSEADAGAVPSSDSSLLAE